MPNALSATVARLGRALYPTDLTDGQLVGRFVAARDGDAFAALVRRHGPMVLAACRRVAGDHHLAEDAFQAAFLVLARRAADVRPREAVRAWLYGVAVRTAREARAMSARRREIPVAAVPDRPAAAEPRADADELRALDEELARLPDHLRAAVVLCELDGASRKDAAARLGIPEGTLSSRLAKARKLLAARLRGRGVALPAGLAALLGRATDAAVPAALSDATCGLAASTCVPAAVAELSRGVFRIMLLKKLKLLTVGVIVTASVVWITGQIGLGGRADDPPAKTEPNRPKGRSDRANKTAPKPKGPSRLMVWKGTKFLFVTPDGKEVGSVNGHPDRLILNGPALSPDGRRVAFTVNEDPPTDDDGSPRRHLMIRDADKADAGLKVEVNALNVAWSADGKTLLVAEYLPAKEAKDRGFATWAVDPKTGNKSPLDLPKTVHAFEFTPDGKAVIAAVYDLETRKAHLARVSRDGKEVAKLTELHTEGPSPRLSPDGRRVLFRDIDPADKPEKEMPRLLRLFVYDIPAKTRSRLADVPLNASLIDFHWSPDGKQVAYAWKQVKPGVPLALNTENINDPKIRTETESFLVVADADGANARTILSDKAGSAPARTIGEFDWRATKADAPQPSEPRNGGKPAAPKPVGLNRLLVANGDKLVLIDPSKQPGEGTEEAVGRGWAGRLSPDGRWLALEEPTNEPRPKDRFALPRPVVRRLDRKGDAILVPKLDPAAPVLPRVGVWSADSSRLLVEQPLTPARSDGWHEKVSWWLFDPATGKADRVPVNVPAWHTIEDWSSDGRTFLAMHYVTRPGKPSVIRLALVPRDGGKPELITPDTQSAYAGRFSPDGKRILFVTSEGDERTGHRFQLFVMNLKDRKPVRISDPEQGEVALSCSWSPDGKRVAYVRRKLFYSPNTQSGGDPGGNFAVVVADADGKNPKVIMARSVVDKLLTVKGLLVCSWR